MANRNPLPALTSWLNGLLARLKHRFSPALAWAGRAKDEVLGSPEKPALRREFAFLREFKPDATAIEERPVPVSIHAVMYALCALMLIAIIWAFVGTLDRIVIAQGKITTTAETIVLQPFAVSKITSIRVKPGTEVHKGDVLMSFDPAFARADESSAISRLAEYETARERMEDEITGKTFEAGLDASPERLTQEQIYRRLQSQLASDLLQRDSKLKDIDSQFASNKAAIAGFTQQLQLARKVTAMRQTLYDKQVGSELQLVTAQKDELDVEQQLRAAKAQQLDLQEQQVQTTAERASYLDNWRRQLNEDLATTRQQAREAADTLSKAKRLQDFTSLTAPVDGTVLEIADRSAGSVMREAETAVTLVPADAPLEVEADVPSRDVGYLAVGDKVRIKLEAYPFQKYGTLNGTLAVVSPDLIVREKGQTSVTVFHVTVHLDAHHKGLAAGVRLRPGLITTAEITTGKRSIASYLLYPVLRIFDESLKEP